MLKVSCKGCHHPILLSTAQKYQGYSRQCLAKQQQLAKGPALDQTGPSHAEILYFLTKTKVTFPKIYYYKEFVRLWALSGSPEYALKQYLNYLNKLEEMVFSLTLTRQESELLYKPYIEVIT